MIKPQLGESYRLLSVVNPFFGIGTVVAINEDGSGTLENEEVGQFFFNRFDIDFVGTHFVDIVSEGVNGALAEIEKLKHNGTIPKHVDTFTELHDYIDANVLLIKHVARPADWLDASDEERDLQSTIDNMVMNLINLSLKPTTYLTKLSKVTHPDLDGNIKKFLSES